MSINKKGKKSGMFGDLKHSSWLQIYTEIIRLEAFSTVHATISIVVKQVMLSFQSAY